jgi:hypothetical protein
VILYIWTHHTVLKVQLHNLQAIYIGILARRIASRDPTTKFKLVIEYKGVPKDKNKLGLFLAPSTSKIMAEYFVKWARIVLNYEVSEDEKRMISETHIDQLTPETKQHYDSFYNKALLLYMKMWEAANKRSHEQLSQLGLKA